MKKSAVVILNYNGEKVLPIFLPSVLANSQSDVWVIDNSSTDSSISLLENEFPEVQLIRLASNFGFAGGYNWGLESLKEQYEYLILLNSDVEVTPDWDQNLVTWLDQNPEFASVQPKILSWTQRDQFDYAGAGGGFLDSLGYPYCRGRIWDVLENDSGQYDDSISVDWASGACMAIRSHDFYEQEGFDAHFFAHMEEIDLCWRLRLSGRKIGYHGAVKVYHLGGATLSRSSPKKLYLNIRNSLSMLYKNLSKPKFWMVFVLKGFLEMLSSLQFYLKGDKDSSQAVVNGYLDFLKTKNLLISNPKKQKDRNILRSGPVRLVFWHFFVLGKKTFSDL
ncbi:glycosyltransferase family 2 protein [Algoriphagus taiwanensis]|uniref:Glycosyltransferase family 2 protein n=1 Tax=Algoriphagus taiwanensis TaxID=1445656 RepID=A0ABQ6Q1H7_9BACT|nr:glycosyltransferase family 2 protein [Algoriphagus taiwanensis]